MSIEELRYDGVNLVRLWQIGVEKEAVTAVNAKPLLRAREQRQVVSRVGRPKTCVVFAQSDMTEVE
jgi:hypothetical protein